MIGAAFEEPHINKEPDAESQEKMLKVANVSGHRDQSDNVQRIMDVNDSYIEAITAKLKILDQI